MKRENNTATVLDADSEVTRRSSGDWLAKITCFLIAFVIWFYVMQVDSPEHTETFHSVDVSLSNVSVLEGERGLSVYSGYGITVDITVIGQKSVIGKLSGDDFTVTADLSGISEPGFHSVAIDVDLPSGLTLDSVSQNYIQVYVDERSTVVTEIRAKLTSFTMESQLEMGELEPEYDTVVVTGPKSALDEIAYAEVKLSLGSINASMTATGQLTLIDKTGALINNPYLRLARTEVRVDIPVYATKQLVLTANSKYGYFNDKNVKITIEPASLLFRGDPAVLSGMDEIVITTLDEKSILGNVTRQVQLELPPRVEVVNGTTMASVKVEHVNTYTKNFTVTDIDVTGAVGLDYDIMTTVLMVQVRGTIEELAKLKTSDFTAVVDLSGYTSDATGVITKNAIIHIDSAYASGVYEIGEYSVQVRLN